MGSAGVGHARAIGSRHVPRCAAVAQVANVAEFADTCSRRAVWTGLAAFGAGWSAACDTVWVALIHHAFVAIVVQREAWSARGAVSRGVEVVRASTTSLRYRPAWCVDAFPVTVAVHAVARIPDAV